MIIDSHCHLTYEPMSNSLRQTIDRANRDGVKYMLTISTEDKSFNKILNILKEHKSVYGTYGIHPHEAKLHQNIKILSILKEHKSVYGTYGIHPHEAKLHQNIKKTDILNKVNQSKKIIGIGETGLDFHYNHSEKKDQIKSFEEHILAAQEKNLPLIVHTRSAEKDTYEILKKYLNKKDIKILIHCFTGTRDFAFRLLDLGAFISASGVVTFKKSQELALTFKKIPNDKILVETDSPYLAPVPLRGKSNEPSYIIHTVKFLSELKGLSFDEFSKITTNNFFSLFGKLN